MPPATIGIGDFAKATHLTIKTLRHYHRIGLLEPAQVDEITGYRRYGTDQIREALIISRFRRLDMPLDTIHEARFPAHVINALVERRDHRRPIRAHHWSPTCLRTVPADSRARSRGGLRLEDSAADLRRPARRARVLAGSLVGFGPCWLRLDQ